MKLKWRLMISLISVSILGFLFFTATAYHTLRHHLLQGADKRLETAAYAVAEWFPPEYHRAITDASSVAPEQFLNDIHRLSRYVQRIGLAYVYTYMLFDGRVVTTATSATIAELQTGTHDRFFEHYESAPEVLYAAFADGQARYVTYADDYGAFRSLFLPLETGDGRRFIIGADIDLDYLQAHLRRLLWVSIAIGAGVFILMVGVIGWQSYYAVSHPLMRLQTTLKEIASDLDLSRRMDTARKDEIGDTANAFNQILEAFDVALKELVATAEQLTHTAGELSQLSHATNGDLTQQQAQIAQVVTAMQQMSTTVEAVARSASEVAGASEHADRQAQTGGRRVQSVVAAMNALALEVKRVGEALHTLDQQSQAIGSVLDVIRGIAEQTNLLALNAAIEAARAGEQGRGFAVVADEVRTLASRTQQSTADIQAMIENLQTGTQRAVNAMQRGQEMAQSTAIEAQQAGQGLEAIMAAVSQIRDMTAQIAGAAEQQFQVNAEIERNLQAMREITVNTLGGATQTAASSKQLLSTADHVRCLLSRFHRRV